MRKLLLLVLLNIVGVQAWALDASFVGGFRHQNATLPPTQSAKLKSTFQFGLTAPFWNEGSFGASTGLMITQRNLTYTFLDEADPFYQTAGTYEFQYMDIPIFAHYSVIDIVKIYVGPSIAFNLTAICRSENPAYVCALNEPKKISLPFTFGVDVKFGATMGLQVFYEVTMDAMFSGELAQNIKNYRAGGLNYYINLW